MIVKVWQECEALFVVFVLFVCVSFQGSFKIAEVFLEQFSVGHRFLYRLCERSII